MTNWPMVATGSRRPTAASTTLEYPVAPPRTIGRGPRRPVGGSVAGCPVREATTYLSGRSALDPSGPMGTIGRKGGPHMTRPLAIPLISPSGWPRRARQRPATARAHQPRLVRSARPGRSWWPRSTPPPTPSSIAACYRRGGRGEDDVWLASAEVCDPASGVFTPAGSMAKPRLGHTATALRDGRVLIGAAGRRVRGTASAEVWDPAGRGRLHPAGSLGTDAPSTPRRPYPMAVS